MTSTFQVRNWKFKENQTYLIKPWIHFPPDLFTGKGTSVGYVWTSFRQNLTLKTTYARPTSTSRNRKKSALTWTSFRSTRRSSLTTPKRRLTRRSRHGVIGMLAVTQKSSEASNAIPNLCDLIKDEDDWTCRFLFCLKQQFRRFFGSKYTNGWKGVYLKVCPIELS